MSTFVWPSVFMEHLLKVGELKIQVVTEEDSLILLPQPIIILIILLHARANFCLPLYALLCYRIYIICNEICCFECE
jgi:hypothetical protein